MGWPECSGMGGRLRPESVAGINRNGWPASPGIGGRNRPEYAGWTQNKKYAADGPGSSLAYIENDTHRCLINLYQHAWLDDRASEIRQSDQI